MRPKPQPTECPGISERKHHRRMWHGHLLGAFFLLSGVIPVLADWPMFRGSPDLRGYITNALPDKLTCLWTYETGGAIQSSAVSTGSHLVFGSDDGNVYALNRTTGKLHWKFDAGSAVEGTPCILGERVYTGSAKGILFCLNLETGVEHWRYTCEDQVLGGVTWAKPQTNAAPSILFGSYDFSLHCLDSQTGRRTWAYKTENFINGTAAVSGNTAIAGGCDGMLHVVSTETGEATNVIPVGGYIAGSPALAENNAYLGHYGNEVMSINLTNGHTNWIYRTGQNRPFFSTPAVTGELVVIGGRDESVHALDRMTGMLRWTFRTRGAVDSSPIVMGNRIVFGSDDGFLYLLDTETGRLLWEYEAGGGISASPAYADGCIYVGNRDGVMFAFGAGN